MRVILFPDREGNAYIGNHDRYLQKRHREGKAPLSYRIRGIRLWDRHDLDALKRKRRK